MSLLRAVSSPDSPVADPIPIQPIMSFREPTPINASAVVHSCLASHRCALNAAVEVDGSYMTWCSVQLIADVDGDGKLELVLGSRARSVHVLELCHGQSPEKAHLIVKYGGVSVCRVISYPRLMACGVLDERSSCFRLKCTLCPRYARATVRPLLDLVRRTTGIVLCLCRWQVALGWHGAWQCVGGRKEQCCARRYDYLCVLLAWHDPFSLYAVCTEQEVCPLTKALRPPLPLATHPRLRSPLTHLWA